MRLAGEGGALISGPRKLIIEVTSRCNLDCPMCLRWQIPQQGDMDLETFSQLRPLFPDAESIVLTGYGESLLNPHILEMVREAREALRVGETMPAVMNAANEMAVEYFLQGLIPFIRIPELIERVMEAHRPERNVELETIQRADGWAREEARAWLARWNGAGRS